MSAKGSDIKEVNQPHKIDGAEDRISEHGQNSSQRGGPSAQALFGCQPIGY